MESTIGTLAPAGCFMVSKSRNSEVPIAAEPSVEAPGPPRPRPGERSSALHVADRLAGDQQKPQRAVGRGWRTCGREANPTRLQDNVVIPARPIRRGRAAAKASDA